jgi:AcrR family transcriptional regulator
MSRWDPDARSRLERAAYELYLERGFDNVTVADIADRVGMKSRSFFRYFADKREVLFSGAGAFQDAVIAAVAEAEADVAPMDAVIAALTEVGARLAQINGEGARYRQSIIAASSDLQERELIKMAALGTAIAEVLRARGVAEAIANLTAQAAIAVFMTAFNEWVDGGGTEEVGVLIYRSLDHLRQAVGTG